MQSPKDRLVLVTGGSSGIGKQVAADYLKLGHRVIIVSDQPERLKSVQNELCQISPECYSIYCDVADNQSVQSMVSEVLAKYGCPSILINSAGYATYRTFEDSDWPEIEALIQVNLLGAMRCVKGFLPAMIARKRGDIVNIASIAGRIILTPNGTYGTAKQGLVAFSEVMKYELARFGIRLHVICPGRVETSFFDHETFRTRASRPETRYTIPVERVSRSLIQAVNRNQFLVYSPWTLGMLAWLINAMPWIVKPIYGRLVLSRIESYYEPKKL